MAAYRRPVTVLLFAGAREAVGRSSLEWPVPTEGILARRLLDELSTRFPALRRTLAASRFVRNGRYLPNLGTRLRPGDEFAVHPPYGGG